MANVDFRSLKEQVTIEQVVKMLDLQMKPKGEQLRGPCPHCEDGGDRALAVTPSKGVFYCFSAKKGGDLITLASHILGLGVRDAAIHISEHIYTSDDSLTVPQKSQEEEDGKLRPLGHLIHNIPCVQQYLTAKDAEAVGIGFCKKGLMRNRIALPLRTPDGTLVGYAGFDPEDCTLKLPPKGLRL